MRPLRRGVTLLELLVGIVLLGITGGLATGGVHVAASAAREAAGSAARRRSISAFQTLLRHDLGGALNGDVRNDGAGSVRFPHQVGAAVACDVTGVRVTIVAAEWNGGRLPAAGRDSAWILVDRDGTWDAAAITAVAAATCQGQPAMDITLDRVVANPIVRVFEPVRVRAYASGGANWLGLEGAGTSIQPFAGPLMTSTSPWTVVDGGLVVQAQFNGASSPTVMQIMLAPP